MSANPDSSGSKNTSIGRKHTGAVTPASAKAFTEREMAFQEKLTPTENLGGGTGLFEGHWVDRTSKADRRMLDTQMLKKTFKDGAVVSLDSKELLKYGEMKEAQAHEIRKLKFAALYPRAGDPATEAKIMAIIPDLELKPMEAFDNRQAEDRALKMMLFYGDLNGEDDLEFLHHVLDPKYIIPMAPAWDSGKIWEEVMTTGAYKDHIDAIRAYKKTGNRFTPWGVDEVDVDAENYGVVKDIQLEIKAHLVKRMLPAYFGKDIKLCKQFLIDNFGYVSGYNVDDDLMQVSKYFTDGTRAEAPAEARAEADE